jgi:PAS domain S-box-containing protein
MPFFLVIGGKINSCVWRCDMKRDKDKTKEQLLEELVELRQQLAELEALERDNKSYEEIYRNLVNMSPDVMYIGSPKDGAFLFLNLAFEKITGWSRAEWVGRPFMSVVHPDDLPLAMERFQQGLEGEIPLPFEARFLCKSGDYVAGEVIGVPHIVNGKVVEGYGFVRNITERKRAEDALRESEEKYRVITNNTYDWEWWLSPVGEFIYMSPSCSRMTGYNASEFKDNAGLLRSIIHPADLPVWDNHRCRTSQGKVAPAVELRILRKDGSKCWIEHICQPVFDDTGKFKGSRGSNRDATDRKQTEEALRESEEKYRSLVERANDGICIIQDKIVKYANLRQAEMWGGAVEELINTPFINYIHPDELPKILDNYNRRMAGEPVSPIYEAALRRKDGSKAYAELNVGVVNYLGKPAELVITRDLTERKKAEEALRESEEKLRLMYESVTEGITITDLNGIIVDTNEAAVRMNGYDSKKQLIGRSSFEFIAGRDHARAAENLKKTLEQGCSGLIEYTLLREDGSEFPGELSASLIRDKAGNPASFVAITRDITERKLIEEEQQIMERLESIGTLAGGIAHDFNNLLTGIMGNIGLAKRHVEPGGKAFERLEEAEKATVRARELTQQLLTFARGGMPVKKLSDISEIIRETAAFALRGSNVRLEISLPDDLWATEVDQGQMNQVIQNIVINADEAMPSGGTLHINAQNMVMKRPGMLPLPKGNYVRADIEDEGIGMSKKQLERIFEPYYTTKQKGSGLGLATAYSIVKNHGGYITVESKQNVGTTFHVYLPASDKPSPTREEVKREMGTTGKGKVLVMDDEEIIREMLGKMLPLAGYEVDLTSDGAEVIERYAEAMKGGKPFSAVIMDLTIPGGMGGKEAIKKLLKIDPDAKVIVSSGYATDPIMSEYKEYGFSAVVTKPYSVAEIEKTLNNILSR